MLSNVHGFVILFKTKHIAVGLFYCEITPNKSNSVGKRIEQNKIIKIIHKSNWVTLI
jgi:hypothetical protein